MKIFKNRKNILLGNTLYEYILSSLENDLVRDRERESFRCCVNPLCCMLLVSIIERERERQGTTSQEGDFSINTSLCPQSDACLEKQNLALFLQKKVFHV